MSKYSSLLFSPERYHEIGPFRFPVYNDLVPGEAKGMEEISRKQSKSTYQSIKLAQRIAKDRGISTKEAVELLSNASDEDNQDILYDYTDALEDLQNYSVGAVEQQVAFVTVFMRYRGEVQLPGTNEWSPVPDWTEADTEAMPSKLMEQVFSFINWERDGWPEPEVGKAPEAEPEFSPPRKKS